MHTIERVLPSKSHLMAQWPRYLLDSVLACSGSLLITGFIFTFQLYPRIPNISNVYVFVVLVLAITRGRYAAILSAVLAFLFYAYFIVPPLYSFAIVRSEEWIVLCTFLLVGVLTAQLAMAQREQAKRRERETRLLFETTLASHQKAEQAHQRLLALEQAARTEAEAERARLYELFMQAPLSLTILRGPEHRYEFANLLSLSHKAHAHPVGQTVREVVPEFVEQGVVAILDQVYTTGTPFTSTELRVQIDRRGDGVLEEGYYNVVYQPTRTLQGAIDGIWVYSVEVTEQVLARRRVEELNRQLEARASELEAIFEAMTEAVAVCDARGEVRYINPAFRSLTGIEEDGDSALLQRDKRFELLAIRDLEGRPLPKEQLPSLRVLRGESLAGAHTVDLLSQTYKGEEIVVNVSGAPIRDATGQIVGGVVAFRDVTERRRLEQQLQDSEHKFHALVESNIFGVVVGQIDGRFSEVNDRFAEIVGYSKNELLAESFNWSQLKPPDEYEALGQLIETILTTGVLPPFEREYLRKDGSRVPILAAGTLLGKERNHVLGVILDMSEQKAAERRKQEFLSMVSHELRTPLTVIMGSIELALLQMDLRRSSLAPEAEELINQIDKGLTRAKGQVEVEIRLVEELLEVSRLEMNTFELSVQQENLATIVQETVANQQQVARTRQIDLTLPQEEVVPVIVDTGRIGQVLSNYLTNALKYAPVEQPIQVSLEVEASMARVSVRDQGPGLTTEQHQRVWERFYQAAEPGRRGPNRGIGLGLAIAKAIIEQHHGHVGVESAPGQGATFWFSVPLAKGLIQS